MISAHIWNVPPHINWFAAQPC